MPRKPNPSLAGYGTISVTHHATRVERARALRGRPGPKTDKPECLRIGHAWAEDNAQPGGLICIVCAAVRPP